MELDMELDEIDNVDTSASSLADKEDMLKMQLAEKDKSNEELTTKLNLSMKEKDDISSALSKSNDKCTELTQKLEEEVSKTTDLWSGWDGEEESRDLDENFMDMGDASLASLGL